MRVGSEAVFVRLLGVCLLWGSDAWKRLSGPPPSDFEQRSLEESPGVRLTARGGDLARIHGEATSSLRCTHPDGTGEIRDLALDPAGRCFVAAERGLFLIAPEVDALDRVDLREGAPPGSPTSVFVDARRRVWIATDEALGVVDPSFFWGRTLAPEDGLPVPGPYRIAGDGEGALLVETPAGLFRYRPDSAPAPVVEEVRLGETPCAAGSTFRATYGDPPVLSGRASPGATLRWRLDGHHVWRDPDLETIDKALAPGAHTLEVIALDRDLDRSAPHKIALAVDYPRRYEPRFLVPLAALAALLLVAGGVAFSVRQGGRRAWARGVVSGIVASVLVGQVVAGLVPHAKAWPFVGFSMYTESHEEGDVTYDEGIVGIDAAGNRRWIDEISLGTDMDNRWHVLGSILEGGEPVARGWLERYNQIHPATPLAGLQVCARRRRLTSAGPVPIAPLIFGSYGRSAAGAAR